MSSATEVTSLKQQVEDVRSVQIEWQKTAKAAEVKLDLQTAQHNKTVEDLRKDITALEASAKLVDTVADLQERNAELDNLLKAKCDEIEENDDRFIKSVSVFVSDVTLILTRDKRVIKDEKKLSSKVEFLTKKVKTLQDKLAAASSQDTTPKAMPLPSASQPDLAVRAQPTSVPYQPPPSRVLPVLPDMPDFSAAGPSSSSAGPSSMGRRTLSPHDRPPVFRARSPEPVRSPVFSAPTRAPPPLEEPFTMSTSTSSTVGVKRRAPDDFDDCDIVPAQTFTADSVPHGDGVNTPRIRRALQSVRTGFTPVRHVKPTPSHGPGSPSRRATTGPAIIADVTNSPRSKSGQGAKRGWLGKIKSSGASSSRTSSRAADKRPQNAGS